MVSAYKTSNEDNVKKKLLEHFKEYGNLIGRFAEKVPSIGSVLYAQDVELLLQSLTRDLNTKIADNNREIINDAHASEDSELSIDDLTVREFEVNESVSELDSELGELDSESDNMNSLFYEDSEEECTPNNRFNRQKTVKIMSLKHSASEK